MIIGRELQRQEIQQIWTIDRREEIQNVYYFENGALVLKPEIYQMSGWPPGEAEKYTPIKFLHVSNGYRKMGLGKKLFKLSKEMARKKWAKGLYISATPSENTIQFYLRQGSVITMDPDPELYELEPEDIHLECKICQY